MTMTRITLAALLLVSVASAQTVLQPGTYTVPSGSTITIPGGPSPLPPPPPPPPTTTGGWSTLANTKLIDVCPPDGFGGSSYLFKYRCPAVVGAWNSGVLDTKRDRLIVWGGGHDDYWGNEVYAVNLKTGTTERLTNPSIAFNFDTSPTQCVTKYGDGQISSRHTYDGIEYLPVQDALYVFGGSMAKCGFPANDTWYFDFATKTWQAQPVSGQIPAAHPGVVTAFDPVTGLLFLHDNTNFYGFNPATKVYARLTNWSPIDYHMTGALDVTRRKFVVVGGNQAWAYELTPPYTRTALNPPAALKSAFYPGLTWDGQALVAWAGGNSIYRYDSATWTETMAPNGPATVFGAAFGRWAFSATLNGYVLVASMREDVRVFRYGAAGPPPPPTPPPRDEPAHL